MLRLRYYLQKPSELTAYCTRLFVSLVYEEMALLQHGFIKLERAKKLSEGAEILFSQQLPTLLLKKEIVSCMTMLIKFVPRISAPN